MFTTRMTRDAADADRMEAALCARIGEVSRWGRITDTLIGVERSVRDFRGRPLYIVAPVVHNRDPLFDA